MLMPPHPAMGVAPVDVELSALLCWLSAPGDVLVASLNELLSSPDPMLSQEGALERRLML